MSAVIIAPANWRETLDGARFACDVAERAADPDDTSIQSIVYDARTGGPTAPILAILEDEAAALRGLADWMEATQTRLLDMARRGAGGAQ